MGKRVLIIGVVVVLAAIAALWLFENYYYDREQTIYVQRNSK